VTNNRVMVARTGRGLGTSSATLATIVGDVRVSFSGAKNIVWLEADQTESTAVGKSAVEKPKRFTFYALPDASVDKIKKAVPDVFDSYNRDHKICKRLEDCLLEGETIKLISDLPAQVVSKNPMRTTAQLFLCLAAPFVVWLLIVAYLDWSNQASIWTVIGNTLLPALALYGVLHLYRRFGENITERARASRLVVTNYRIFQAPSDAVMARGQWHGRKDSLDLYFADQLSATRGSARKVDYYDFKSPNYNYTNGTDNRYATVTRRIWVKNADQVFESFPDYFKNNQFEYRRGEYISDEHVRALAFIAARKARLEIEGIKGEISTD
jgi:hypothetical protein